MSRSLEQVSTEIAKQLIHRRARAGRRRAFAVGITGDTALGKSTFARALQLSLNSEYCQVNLKTGTPRTTIATILETDSFILSRSLRSRSGIATGEDPRAIDFAALRSAIVTLRHRHHELRVPVYSHRTGRKTGRRTLRASMFLLIDGSCALYEQVRDLVDLGIFLDATKNTRRHLRRVADTTTRGYSSDSFQDHWTTYDSSYRKHIEPQREHCAIELRVTRGRRLYFK